MIRRAIADQAMARFDFGRSPATLRVWNGAGAFTLSAFNDDIVVNESLTKKEEL